MLRSLKEESKVALGCNQMMKMSSMYLLYSKGWIVYVARNFLSRRSINEVCKVRCNRHVHCYSCYLLVGCAIK